MYCLDFESRDGAAHLEGGALDEFAVGDIGRAAGDLREARTAVDEQGNEDVAAVLRQPARELSFGRDSVFETDELLWRGARVGDGNNVEKGIGALQPEPQPLQALPRVPAHLVDL